MATLTPRQIWICAVAERVSSSISVTGTLMIFLCYFSIKRFRTLLSNRLLIIASFANLGSNAATLIGNSGLVNVKSSVCQAQAFLLEWLMQTDPLFGTCMAIDVYLVIVRRFTHGQVKSIFKWYAPICYGIPLLPALVCVAWRGENGTMIYGSAGIWCWIDNEFAYIRIYSYYGPVWISLIITFIIYIRVGYEIVSKRSALRAFGHDRLSNTFLITGSQLIRGNGNRSKKARSSPPAFSGLRTMEVEVSSTNDNLTVPEPVHLQSSHNRPEGNFVDITADEGEPRRSLLNPKDWVFILLRSFGHLDKVTVAYCKCAGLFSLSILITWVPSSANRVYGLIHPNNASFGLNFAAAAVLPLQGFWNTTIFLWTSWNIVKTELRERRRMRAFSNEQDFSTTSQVRMAERGQRGVSPQNPGDTESTKDVLGFEDDIATISDETGHSSVRTFSERSPSK